ncbi:MAG: hypothetical protein ACLVK8_04680 [Ruminococcus sp.]
MTFDTSLSAGSGKDIIILNKAFRKGVLQGIPIALGYLSVSFGFGILAVRAGFLSLPPWQFLSPMLPPPDRLPA